MRKPSPGGYSSNNAYLYIVTVCFIRIHLKEYLSLKRLYMLINLKCGFRFHCIEIYFFDYFYFQVYLKYFLYLYCIVFKLFYDYRRSQMRLNQIKLNQVSRFLLLSITFRSFNW